MPATEGPRVLTIDYRFAGNEAVLGRVAATLSVLLSDPARRSGPNTQWDGRGCARRDGTRMPDRGRGWEKGESENRSRKPETTKKPRKTGALAVENLCCSPCSGPGHLLLFLRGGLLRCFLFGCALHRLILPKHQILRLEKSQCDSYIRLFTMKVKKKMNLAPVPISFRLQRAEVRHSRPRCRIRRAISSSERPRGRELRRIAPPHAAAIVSHGQAKSAAL